MFELPFVGLGVLHTTLSAASLRPKAFVDKLNVVLDAANGLGGESSQRASDLGKRECNSFIGRQHVAEVGTGRGRVIRAAKEVVNRDIELDREFLQHVEVRVPPLGFIQPESRLPKVESSLLAPFRLLSCHALILSVLVSQQTKATSL